MHALFDVVALGEIMASTQYLDVRGVFRCTPFRVRNDVVKMKAGIRPAFLAPPLITLPYFYLDPAWYEAIRFSSRQLATRRLMPSFLETKTTTTARSVRTVKACFIRHLRIASRWDAPFD